MIDSIAERYGLLPSQVLTQADTFDIYVSETAIRFRNSQTERAYDKQRSPDSYSQDELLKIVEATHAKGGREKSK